MSPPSDQQESQIAPRGGGDWVQEVRGPAPTGLGAGAGEGEPGSKSRWGRVAPIPTGEGAGAGSRAGHCGKAGGAGGRVMEVKVELAEGVGMHFKTMNGGGR